LNVYYKNTRIKQYHKEKPGLTHETTINNSYDFAVANGHESPEAGVRSVAANRKLLESNASATIAFSARIPSRLSTARSLPAASALGLRFADPGLTRLACSRLVPATPARLPRRRFAPASRELIGMQSSRDLQGTITYQLRRLACTA